MPEHRWPDPLRPPSSATFPAALRLLVSAITGVGLALAFNWFYFPLYAWVSIGVLLMMVLGTTPRVAFFCGYFHTFAFVLASVPWIAEVLAVHGGMSRLAGWGVLLLIAAVLGILTAVFTWTVHRISQRSILLACVAAPFVWVAMEFVRAHMPEISFPWNLLGYSAAANPAFLQSTTLTGIYGLSFLMMAFNSLLSWADAAKTISVQKRATIVGAASAVILIIAFLGPRFLPQSHPNHLARAVQPNFPEVDLYPPDWFEVHKLDLDELEELSLQPTPRRVPGFVLTNPGLSSADLIIWPEVPAPFSWEDNHFSKIASSLATRAGHPFLAGDVEWKQESLANGHTAQAPYNSAVLVDTQGQRIFTYDKRHLVPFGEYEPFPLIHRVVQSVSDEVGGFHKGSSASVGTLPGGYKFGVYICYEAIYPGEVREFAASGANLLINISNDGWFGKSAAAQQHLLMARVRAVENRRWVLRVTNSGLTASIDPYGRIDQRIPRDVRGAIDLPYDFRTDTTLYTRFGDWFAWMCVLVSVILLLQTFWKRK